MGQSSVVSIPDPGSATANFILSASGSTQHITAGGLVVDAGAIQSGLAAGGINGNFVAYPTTAAKGFIQLLATTNATGNFATTITNAAAVAQSITVTIPDPAGATANFVLAPAALVSGNAVKASGTAGLIADAGYAFHAGTTGTYAGGGTSNAFTATGMASTWIVTATILTSTNAVAVAKAVPSANTLTITFTADPGASTTVSWVASTGAV